MNKFILIALLIIAPGLALAEGAHAPYQFKTDLGNQASLQRGAAAFMSYCSGCHSLKYMRYNRLAQDLGIPEDLVMKHLAFSAEKPGETIQVAMPAADGIAWFGRAPPDLTLVARARGADWIYSYLLTFYLDPSRPNGVNNLMLQGLSMPHVLGELQGWQKLVDEKAEGAEAAHEEGHHKGPKFELVQAGSMSPEQYKGLVGDLTNFLVYTAEPVKLIRYGLGTKVLFFLLLFTILAYLLKQEFWKDVH